MPAIDLRKGRMVRLEQGDDRRRTEYEEAPAEVLRRFADAGVRRAHLVDLDAALGEEPQRELLEELAALPGVPELQLGGGLRDREAVEWSLANGFARAVITSLMVRDFALFAELAEQFPRRLVAALDLRDGELEISGWQESAAVDLDPLCARLRKLPLAAILVTDIERDGMLCGPNVELAARLGRQCGVPAILSGGVSSLDDLRRAAEIPEIGGAVIGKALHDGRIDLGEAQKAVAGATPRPPALPPREISGLAARIIPCLDVAKGRVVKGIQFRNLTDQGDPAECALRYYQEGADEIVFLDITAAPERRDTDLEWVRRTAEQVFIPLTVGGGVRSVEDGRRLLLAGADKLGINTAAWQRPELLRELAERFGRQCVVLSIDARRSSGTVSPGTVSPGRRAPRWEVVTHGGRTATGLDAVEWARRAVELGAGEILLTSIDSDGTQNGYDLDLIRVVVAAVDVPVIASGGAGAPEHLAAGLAAGAAAVLAASIFHQSTYTVDELKSQLEDRFPMRRAYLPSKGPRLIGRGGNR